MILNFDEWPILSTLPLGAGDLEGLIKTPPAASLSPYRENVLEYVYDYNLINGTKEITVSLTFDGTKQLTVTSRVTRCPPDIEPEGFSILITGVTSYSPAHSINA